MPTTNPPPNSKGPFLILDQSQAQIMVAPNTAASPARAPYPVVVPQPDEPMAHGWEPEMFVPGEDIGVAWDDGCVVVLVPNALGHWHPLQWVPPEAIPVMAELAERHSLLS